jgi:hypothetical protein
MLINVIIEPLNLQTHCTVYHILGLISAPIHASPSIASAL